MDLNLTVGRLFLVWGEVLGRLARPAMEGAVRPSQMPADQGSSPARARPAKAARGSSWGSIGPLEGRGLGLIGQRCLSKWTAEEHWLRVDTSKLSRLLTIISCWIFVLGVLRFGLV
jgi:hypothetical protein